MRRAYLLLACLGLTACGSGTHSPAAAPSPTPSARGLANAVELDRFDGLHARPSVSTKLSGNRSRSVLSMTPDGLLITVVNEAPPAGPDPGIKQSRLELVDPAGDTVAIPGRDGDGPRQAVYADSDERTVTWLETPSTQAGAADWVLLAYDRATRQTHVVARAAEGDGTVANAPMLNRDRVWWSVIRFNSDEHRPPTTDLYSRGLSDSAPTRLEVSDIHEAALSDNRLVYSDAATGPYRQIEIHQRYLGTGADSVLETVGLSPEAGLHSLTASGDDVAWVKQEYGAGARSAVTLNQADDTVTTISGGLLSLTVDVLTPDLLAWHDGNDNGGEWLLDRHDNRIVHLSSQPGLAAIVGSGNHLAWREGDTWRVADLI